jgi:hypothetical protein
VLSCWNVIFAVSTTLPLDVVHAPKAGVVVVSVNVPTTVIDAFP